MAFNTAGIIHYMAITCYFVHDYIIVVLNTLLSGRLIVLLIIIRPKLVKNYQLQTASFVRETVLIREGSLELPNCASLSRLELDQLAHVVSTS